jgi:hypothetical protein
MRHGGKAGVAFHIFFRASAAAEANAEAKKGPCSSSSPEQCEECDQGRRRKTALRGGFLCLAVGRGWMAGNGRVMKNKEQDSDKEQPDLDAAEEMGNELPASLDSVAWLCDLADKELGKNGRKIINGLVEKAKKGDGPSIRQLLALAKGKTLKDACLTPGGKTLAQMLAEEPEWLEPPEGAETDKNDVEPAE